MRFWLILIPVVLLSGLWWGQKRLDQTISGAPPYGIAEIDIPENINWWSWLETWKRPEGPATVAIQIGHKDNHLVPDELENLRKNGGANAGGFTEAEVNEAIAKQMAMILRAKGVEVTVLPTTIPPGFWADVFVSIHADGSENTSKRGFKIGTPWRDMTGKSMKLKQFLEPVYQEATGFEMDENITRNMRGYYAFSWWRYEHALHPMTTAVIVETGFLTNVSDREILVTSPQIPAHALANGILSFLTSEALI